MRPCILMEVLGYGNVSLVQASVGATAILRICSYLSVVHCQPVKLSMIYFLSSQVWSIKGTVILEARDLLDQGFFFSHVKLFWSQGTENQAIYASFWKRGFMEITYIDRTRKQAGTETSCSLCACYSLILGCLLFSIFLHLKSGKTFWLTLGSISVLYARPPNVWPPDRQMAALLSACPCSNLWPLLHKE